MKVICYSCGAEIFVWHAVVIEGGYICKSCAYTDRDLAQELVAEDIEREIQKMRRNMTNTCDVCNAIKPKNGVWIEYHQWKYNEISNFMERTKKIIGRVCSPECGRKWPELKIIDE